MNKMKSRAIRSMSMVLGLLAVLAIASQAMAAKQAPSSPININTATVQQLTEVPGIGPAKAQAIVSYRDKTPFGSTNDLVNVDGIGEKLLAKIAPYVTVSGNSAESPGTAGKATR
ncbi:MAG: helix-hairpin-helix domain-containing protein [bacterium]